MLLLICNVVVEWIARCAGRAYGQNEAGGLQPVRLDQLVWRRVLEVRLKSMRSAMAHSIWVRRSKREL
jgi:hypothetical protein